MEEGSSSRKLVLKGHFNMDQATNLMEVAVNLVSISVEYATDRSIGRSLCLSWDFHLVPIAWTETDRNPSEIGRKIGLKAPGDLETFTGIGLRGTGLGRSDLRPVAEHGLATREI